MKSPQLLFQVRSQAVEPKARSPVAIETARTGKPVQRIAAFAEAEMSASSGHPCEAAIHAGSPGSAAPCAGCTG